MNKGLLVLNIVLLLAVGVLFYLYFTKINTTGASFIKTDKDSAISHRPFRVAYFDMDSVEANFVLAKEMQTELSKKDDQIAGEMNRLQNNYQQKFQKYQQEGPAMTEAQVESAQRDLFQLEQNMKSRKMQLDQDYQSYFLSKQQEIFGMIRKFCQEYNADGRYTLIIANEPGLIYYKDSTYNITSDLLKGLNEMYARQKKSR